MLMNRLERSDKAENTLVVYLSDHGAQFSRGKTTAYEGGVRVPMIMRWPGHIGPSLVSEALASAIDILPTILDATRIEGPTNLPGRSLLPLGRGQKTDWREYLFTGKAGSTAFWAFPQRTVRDDRYKMILNLVADAPCPVATAYEQHKGTFFITGSTTQEIADSRERVRQAYDTWRRPPKFELYDLKSDPYEFRNLAGQPEYRAVQDRLFEALSAWQRQTNDPFADPEKLAEYLKETSRVTEQYGGQKGLYRRDKSFRWQYLDYLAPP
jgi:N-sulfoglucosamine sulfohydrolase